MIAKVFSADAQVIYQEGDGDDIGNSAILVHIDSGGTLCVTQENSTVVIDRTSIPELISTLKKYIPVDKKKGKS